MALGKLLVLICYNHNSTSHICLGFMCSWNALNDYLDLEIDKVNRPERPLPSGDISVKSAKKGIAIMMAISVLSILVQ